ncbi:MAG: 2-oxoglutarate dehydrogenase E1 component [uncultured Phycisphaerae bacterium]|uniref:oxoglutarate dehydrogenase (succinyl-transferring) n=1 Tax=uncultured Phycisphaerae bacterium TaxID=904963 RepID=A0A6J4QKM0_9BACT|nr:MAG: 2-oxoglutarate dehydrogenase E1 component [uncultured Phycisphaerae bacterium]
MDRLDFVTRVNPEYVDRLYEQYQRDPRSVDESWRQTFAGMDGGNGQAGNGHEAGGNGAATTAATTSGATPTAATNGTASAYATSLSTAAAGAAPDAATLRIAAELPVYEPLPSSGVAPLPALTLGVHKLVHSYRELGHFVANLDPLGHNRTSHPLLELSQFNMTEADMDRTVGSGGFLGPIDGTLGDLINNLKATYCRSLGIEFQNISDKVQREWLAQQMEPVLNRPSMSKEQARAVLFQMVAAEEFEQFLRRRFQGMKTFSLEGAESLIPLLNTLVDDGAAQGAEEICFGMPHRGRLSVLAHVLNKPYEVIFSEFKYTNVHQEWEGDGDVKYHLGYANERAVPGGTKSVHLSLSPNPSHLELVNPVVEGSVRCKQKIRGDKDHSKVVPILLHGDAAFTGQGVVFETLNLSELPFWRTGGTIHVIVNNQIGFTTPPHEGRFTPYPTDVAKMIQAPIFHVNGDDPQAVAWAAKLAIAFRQKFKVDVFIDLWCYRRFGHNEADEPMFTQPKMYRQIKEHRTTRELFQDRLLADGTVDQKTLDDMKKVALERLEAALVLAGETRPRQKTAAFNPLWKNMVRIPTDWSAVTKVPKDVLTKIAESVNRFPAGFTPHGKLAGDGPRSTYTARLNAVKKGEGIDWGTGEMLAMGSLLLEGTPVRFTGQDVQRGTFSHRQAVLMDQETGDPHTPLNFLVPDQKAHLTIQNSMLSEMAVLGFEYGFASADPRNLVVWEAQFGDFVNGAQPIIDQFITAAESKWQLMNGLVMMLPHGYEGQGPEHSNAYVERWLSLCAENNIQVCQVTTPAQVFHALRRQIHRKFRKPLVLLQPKSMLRAEYATSKLEEFTDGSMQLVIDDPTSQDREKVRRVLFCTGKVYYTLAAARAKENLKDVAIVRVEQLYPFPKKEVQAVLAKYRNARDVSWVQDEPRNRGAWSFMEPRLLELLPDPATLHYFGRDEAASPATGSTKMHKAEEDELVQQALEIAPKAPTTTATPAAATAGGPKPAPSAVQVSASSPMVTQQMM